jgi:hypothetical protein
MEVTAAVLYDGALAHYDVQVRGDRECVATLSSYNGNSSSRPPRELVLRKEGRHWVSTSAAGHLPDDLGYAVELKVKPLMEGRRRNGGHPAAS